MDNVHNAAETDRPLVAFSPTRTESEDEVQGAWDDAAGAPQLAGADDSAPNLGDYRSIGPQDGMGAGTITYETKDGQSVLVSQSVNPELYDQVVNDGKTLTAIGSSAAQGYDLADSDATSPGLENYKEIGPADEVGPGLVRYETTSGDKVIVSQQTNPELYEKVTNDSKTLSAIGSSGVEGYELADSDEAGPALQDYKAIGPADEVGPGLIRYETASGDKVIVSQETNPELYDQVAADYDKLGTINQAVDDGYSLAGGDATVPSDIDLASVEDLGNGVLRYETAGGDKVVVSQDYNSGLYDQVSGLSTQKEGIEQSRDAGYTLAGSDATAPALTEYKGIRPPDELGEGLIGYTDSSGQKVVVSKENNPELFDQVSADYEKASAIKQSKDEGYVLTNDKYSEAPDFSVVGSPDEFGNGIIRFETASGDKYIVSQDINPQLYDAAVDAYNRFSSAA